MSKAITWALAACGLLAACQPARPPAPAVAYAPPAVEPAPRKVVKSHPHHATFANGARSSGDEAQFATECSWPTQSRRTTTPRLNSSTVQTQTADLKAAGIEAQGCAILRFSLSPSGKVNWVEVAVAKPSSIAPLAMKCLLAASFKPDRHPEATSLVRVDVKKLDGDVVMAALKLR